MRVGFGGRRFERGGFGTSGLPILGTWMGSMYARRFRTGSFLLLKPGTRRFRPNVLPPLGTFWASLWTHGRRTRTMERRLDCQDGAQRQVGRVWTRCSTSPTKLFSGFCYPTREVAGLVVHVEEPHPPACREKTLQSPCPGCCSDRRRKHPRQIYDRFVTTRRRPALPFNPQKTGHSGRTR